MSKNKEPKKLTPFEERKARTLVATGAAADRRTAERKVRGGKNRLRRQLGVVAAAGAVGLLAHAAVDAIPDAPVPEQAQSPDLQDSTVSVRLIRDDNPDTPGTMYEAAANVLKGSGYHDPTDSQISDVVDESIARIQETDPDFDALRIQDGQYLEIASVAPPN